MGIRDDQLDAPEAALDQALEKVNQKVSASDGPTPRPMIWICGALIAMLAAAGLSPTAVTIATILVYVVSLLSIAGTVLAFARPVIATALFVVSGLAWLMLSFTVTASPGSSVDPKSMIIPLVLANALAALLAWLAARRATTPNMA